MINKLTIQNIVMILILMIGLAAGVILIRAEVFFKIRASGTENITIYTTNIDSTSFTVLWVIDQKNSGFVRWGESPNNLDRIALSTSQDEKTADHVTINNLKPRTDYYYMVVIDNQLYGDINKEAKKVRTGIELEQKAPLNSIFGSVIDSNGYALANAIVYVQGNDLNPISTITDSQGGWILSLSNVRHANLQQHISLDEQNMLTITVQSSLSQAGVISLPIKDLKPAPQIVVFEKE